MLREFQESKKGKWYKQQLGESWFNALLPFLASEEMEEIRQFIVERRKHTAVFPESEFIFRAFKLTPLDEVKAIILGEAPYCIPNCSDGLAFSSKKIDPPPAALRNIIFEVSRDYQVEELTTDGLASWARQGILLLNTSLTVDTEYPGEHSKIWFPFIKEVMTAIMKNSFPPAVASFGHNNFYYYDFLIKKAATSSNSFQWITTNSPDVFNANLGFIGSNAFIHIQNHLAQKDVHINFQL